MMELITLSIPVYNVEKYVESALLSALDQTYPNLEILVVDDCGQDGSMEIVYRIQKMHPRGNSIRVIVHERNMGLGETRNTAIAQARGRYLYFMDSDDRITPDCIQCLYEVMNRERVDFVMGGIHQVDEEGNSMQVSCYPDLVQRGRLCLAKFLYVQRKRTWVVAWNRLYDLTFLKEARISFLPHVYYEDEPVHVQLALKAHSFALISSVTYLYCMRQGSITNPLNGRTLKHLNDLIIVYNEVKKIIKSETSLNKSLLKEINLYYLMSVFSIYISLMPLNVEEGALRDALMRFRRHCIPPMGSTRLTKRGILMFIFMRFPIDVQRVILTVRKIKK